jgi:hypothetical protein
VCICSVEGCRVADSAMSRLQLDAALEAGGAELIGSFNGVTIRLTRQ